jgi:hypothetical protein
MIEFVAYAVSIIVCFIASVLVARNYVNEAPAILEKNAGAVAALTLAFLMVMFFYKQWQRDVNYLCANVNKNKDDV